MFDKLSELKNATHAMSKAWLGYFLCLKIPPFYLCPWHSTSLQANFLFWATGAIHYKYCLTFLTAGNQCFKGKPDQILIGELYQIFVKLTLECFVSQVRKANPEKNCFLQSDKLYIDSKIYVYNEVLGQVVEHSESVRYGGHPQQ